MGAMILMLSLSLSPTLESTNELELNLIHMLRVIHLKGNTLPQYCSEGHNKSGSKIVETGVWRSAWGFPLNSGSKKIAEASKQGECTPHTPVGSAPA